MGGTGGERERERENLRNVDSTNAMKKVWDSSGMEIHVDKIIHVESDIDYYIRVHQVVHNCRLLCRSLSLSAYVYVYV